MTGTGSVADELNRIGYQMLSRRVHAAEAVAYQALTMTPQKGETAGQLSARIRRYAETTHPELVIRMEHSRQEVLALAESCGCDPDDETYGDNHCESDRGVEYLCERSHLGWICGTCENEDGDGPSWSPDRYEWPCPPVAALDKGESR